MYNWISRLLYPRLLPLQTVLHFKYNKIWKSWVFFSLFVLKLFLLTFLGLINSERCWKGIFLIPYTFLSISSFLSFFFWKDTNVTAVPVSNLYEYMRRRRIRKQVRLCCFQSNASSLQWLQLHQLPLLQYHSQQLQPCQLCQRTAWIFWSFQSSNERCIYYLVFHE